MRTAIVTGASGFIGQSLLRELRARGVKVYAVTRKPVPCGGGEEEGVKFVRCDMEQLQLLPQKIKQSIDTFFHLAWEGSTGDARGDYHTQLKNAEWTAKAVEVAHQMGCTRFVGAGTLAELDVNAYIPQDGSSPNRVSCYGSAKIAAHYMSKAVCSRFAGMQHCWAYISNTYGIGNYTSNFVNFAVKLMIQGRSADFTSGDQMYDFVSVTDTAQGLAGIGESGKANCAYYIGSGHPAPLKVFIRQIRDAVDPETELHLGAVPFHGISQPRELFDCHKLMIDTGYQPKVTFENGIRETVPWIREQIACGKI